MVVACALAVMLTSTGSAAAQTPTTYLQLNGYGGVPEQILTPEDVILFGTVGSFGSPFGSPQPDLFISSLDLSTFERWRITLVPPLGSPLAPGTYPNAGGFGAFPTRPVIQVLHHGGLPFNHTCDGGTFTINSIDVAHSFFDVEWTQECLGHAVSGRAVFALPDTAPPVIDVRGSPLVAAATGPDGAVVHYEVTAHDTVDGSVPASCTPSPGSTFPIGTTTVSCTATDAADNVGHATFEVRVLGASEQVEILIGVFASFAPGSSLADKLRVTLSAINAGDLERACGTLAALANEARAQSGKKLTTDQANEVISHASRIRSVLAC